MKKLLLFSAVFTVFAIRVAAQTILGIDVSHYQGTINWTQVAAAGKTFAWTKATEGVTYTDPTYATFYTNGSAAGVVMGAYHFARPETNTAVAEANYFVSVIGANVGPGKLPPALDLEDPPSGPALTSYFTSSALTTWAQTFMTTVENATGVRPVLYTSGSIASYLNSSINIYPLWIANPATSATTPPANIGVWTTWAAKQYSWTGSVSGISGNVDLNVFNGDAAAFNNFINDGTVVHNPTLCGNDTVCNSLPALAINSSCTNSHCSTINATGPTPNIPFQGASACTSLYQTGRYDDDVWFTLTPSATNPVTINVTPTSNTSNFDVCIGLYTTTGCPTFTQVTCADLYSAGVAETATFTPVSGTTYYVRVFSYGIGSSYAGNFDICATSTVPTTVDLTITSSSQTASPGTVCAGASVTASCSESNSGTGSSAASSVTVWLSTDAVLNTGNDTYLGTISGFPSIAAGATSSVLSNSVTIPSNTTAGTYYLYFWADGLNGSGTGNVVSESNESNNYASTQITVNALPSAVTVNGGGAFCSNPTLTASGGTGGTIYWQGTTSSGTSTATASSSQVVSSSGTYYFRANNGCGWGTQGSTAVTINVTPAQPGTISGSTSVCQSSSQTYSVAAVAGATSYTWSLPNGWTGNSSGASITVMPGSSGGTISVIANSSCGSSAAQTLSVSVNPVPAAVTVSGAGTFCGNTTLTASGGTGGTIYWQGTTSGGTSTVTVSSSQSVSSSGTYYFRANNSCGWGTEGSATVTINSLPTAVTVSGGGAVCNNTILTASGGTGGTIYWQETNSGGTSMATASSSQTVSSSGTYYFRSYNSCGWGTEGSVAVTINTVPAQPGTITGSSGVCQNSSQPYSITTVSGATAYTWTLPNGWTGSSAGTSITTTVGSSGGTVSVTADNACGSSSPQTFPVTVNPVPTNVSASANPSAACQGGTVNLTSSATGATSYSWTGPGGYSSAQQNPSIANVQSGQGGTYTVNAINACGSAANTTTVTVDPIQPASVSISASATTVCSNENVSFTAVPVGGGNAPVYAWYVNGGLQVATGSTFTISNAQNNATVYCTLASSLACASGSPATSNSVSITIASQVTPTISITAFPTGTICTGTPVTFTANGGNGGSAPLYQWMINGNPTGSNSSASTFTSSALTNGAAISCVLTSNSACVANPTANSNQLTMAISPLITPVISISASPAGAVCAGATVSFSANVANGGGNPVYVWKINGVAEAANSPVFTSNLLSNGDVITCDLTGSLSCSSGAPVTSNAITMSVNPLPVATITPQGSTTICDGDSVELDGPAGYPGYSWNTNSTSQNIYAKFVGAYTVTVTSVFNCTASSLPVQVSVNQLPPVPVISQNGTTLTSSPATTYQWYINGAILNGETSQSLLISQNGQYQVAVTNANGCRNQSASFSAVINGIENTVTDYGVKLYPNPNNGTFVLEFTSDESKDVEITDAIGKVVFSFFKVDREKQLSLKDAAPGVYFLNIKQGGQSRSLKFSLVK